MKNEFYGSVVALLAGAGFAVAQEPPLLPFRPMQASPSPVAPGLSYWTTPAPADPMMMHSAPDRYRAWGSVEYVLWWLRDPHLPNPLVTSGDPNSNNPGALNAGGTPLFGGAFNHGGLSGIRMSAGVWLDSSAIIGIEGSGFVLPKQSRTFSGTSDANGNPVLAFRYIDAPPPINTGAEDAFQASIPGQFRGRLAVQSSTLFWGTEANLVFALRTTDTCRFQGLLGFRYLDFTDTLSLSWLNQALPGSVVPFLGNNFGAPNAISSIDCFQARNQFYGGQIGLRGECSFGNAFVGVSGKLALGSTHEVLQISGMSALLQPGAAASVVNVGQFAGPSNIGRFTRNQFATVPEVDLKLGYNITPNVRVFVGYDFLYLSNVVRANSQVDLIVDTRANPVNGGFVAPTPTTTFPRVPFVRTDVWAQGLNAGLEVRY
jgi:hypothetical protein